MVDSQVARSGGGEIKLGLKSTPLDYTFRADTFEAADTDIHTLSTIETWWALTWMYLVLTESASEMTWTFTFIRLF